MRNRKLSLMENRQVCHGCGQNLSRSAYFRHKIESVCPGKSTSLLRSPDQRCDKSSPDQELHPHHPDDIVDTEYSASQQDSVPHDESGDSESVCDEEKDNCDQLGIEVFEDNDAPEIKAKSLLVTMSQYYQVNYHLQKVEQNLKK